MKSVGRYPQEITMSTVGLFQFGKFVLNSGIVSAYKIDCDALKVWDWETVARWVCRLIGPFSSVEGVPRGGLKLATLLVKYQTSVARRTHLIVDDVLTTGGSMERLRRRREYPCCEGVSRIETVPGDATTLVSGVCSVHGLTHYPVVGAVLFARGPLPSWVKAVFPMPPELWDMRAPTASAVGESSPLSDTPG